MTQVNATYDLMVDLNGDLDYGDANEDLSAYWKRITVDCGMSNPGDHMGRSATLVAVLNNTSNRFSPEHTSGLSGFTRGCKIRLRMTYSATTVTMYEGRIDEIAPTPGANGGRECVIRCNGYLRRLQEGEIAIAIKQHVRTDEIAASVLAAAEEWPGVFTGWLLGDTTWSKLGSTTALSPGVSSFADMDTCAGRYALAGNNFEDRASPYGALRTLIESERGWLFEDRDGKLKLWSRHHLVKDLANAIAGTLSDSDFAPLAYSYGERLINEMEVRYHARRIDGIGIPLGRSNEAVKIKTTTTVNKPVTVTIEFKDEDTGQKVGGINLINPVPGYDFVANSKPNGSGKDVTKYVAVSVEPLGDKADVTFAFNQPGAAHILAGAQIRGTRVLDYGDQKVVYEDEASILAYHTRQVGTIDAALVEDAEMADNLARWEVGHYTTPMGQLERVAFYANKNATLMAHARDRDIGDRLHLTETQTGTDGEYFIIGKRVELTPQNVHYETWTLEPRPQQSYWLLGSTGFTELGPATTIGA